MSQIEREQTAFGATDYRYKCVLRTVTVGTGRYFKWIKVFTTSEEPQTCYCYPVDPVLLNRI